ncbi:MAG: flagellar M-ring protein FliF, partial [Oleiphilaceae bacterium]
MANVPAQKNANLPAQIGGTSMAETDSIGAEGDLMTGINRLGIFRQVGLMIGLAGSVALGLALVLWLQEPNYQPLMQNIKSQDLEEVTQLLSLNDV